MDNKGMTNNEYAAIMPVKLKSIDSVQNFYLFINNSYTINAPVYYIDIPYNLTVGGALTIPFKYQLSYKNKRDSILTVPDNLTSSVNIAGYLGVQWGSTRFYNNPSNTYNRYTFLSAIFTGPTVISLSSSGSSYDIVTTKKETSKSLSPSTAGWTLGIAQEAVFGSFNIGLFLGFDLPLTPDGSTWYYSSIVSLKGHWDLHPWIGLGIGYNLGSMFSGTSASLKHDVNGSAAQHGLYLE
jgi:hypothetical protein